MTTSDHAKSRGCIVNNSLAAIAGSNERQSERVGYETAFCIPPSAGGIIGGL